MSILTQMIKTCNSIPWIPLDISEVVLSGLIRRFPADGTVDDVINNKDGVFSSPAYSAGKYGQAFSFASSRYVELANSDDLNSTTATWSFWMKGTTIPASTGSIMGKVSSSSSMNGVNILLRPTTGYLYVQIKSGSAGVLNVDSRIKVQDGNWHHIVFAFSAGNSYALYIDNALNSSGSLSSFTIANNPMRIARSVDSYWASYTGLIDEIRIYNRMITAEEVNTLYSAQ